MDILVRNFLTEERTVFKQIDSQVAACLIATGLAAPYEKSPAAQSQTFNVQPSNEPRWGVGKGAHSYLPHIFFQRGASTEFFDGPPDSAKRWRADCPDEVIAAYKAALGNDAPKKSVGR